METDQGPVETRMHPDCHRASSRHRQDHPYGDEQASTCAIEVLADTFKQRTYAMCQQCRKMLDDKLYRHEDAHYAEELSQQLTVRVDELGTGTRRRTAALIAPPLISTPAETDEMAGRLRLALHDFQRALQGQGHLAATPPG